MLKIQEHHAGFFSSCNIRLRNIIMYFNTHKSLPVEVNSSGILQWYKKNHIDDIIPSYFKSYKDTENILYTEKITITQDNSDDQFSDYRLINFTKIQAFITKYFSPSNEILSIIDSIEKKYNILDYSNICVLFHRGNDKIRETPLCSYDSIIDKANNILKLSPNIRFLIQSDETEFIKKRIVLVSC